MNKNKSLLKNIIYVLIVIFFNIFFIKRMFSQTNEMIISGCVNNLLDTIDINLNVQNDSNFIGFQTDISFPECFKYLSNTSNLTYRKNNSVLKTISLDNNIVRFVSLPNYTEAPIKKLYNYQQDFRLKINTPDSTNQAVHPDVLYIEKGFGPEKFTYWMVCTPYYHSDNKVENPCIYGSYDGINWIVPKGVTNPLDTAPGILFKDHNCDTDILLNSDSTQLWIYYQQSHVINDTIHLRLLKLVSNDGILWNGPYLLLDSKTEGFMSPAIVWDSDSGKYYMWSNDFLKSPFELNIRESINGNIWTNRRKCTLNSNLSATYTWHLDVIKRNNRYEALINVYNDHNNLYFAFCNNKLNWQAKRIMIPHYNWDKGYLYRSSLIPFSYNNQTLYRIWYSAWSGDTTNNWTMSYTNMLLNNNDSLIGFPELNYKYFTGSSGSILKFKLYNTIQNGNFYINLTNPIICNNEYKNILNSFQNGNIMIGNVNSYYCNNICKKAYICQIYPNPMTINTNINYFVPEYSEVKLSVYNLYGKEIEIINEQIVTEGYYNYCWTPKFNMENETYIIVLFSKSVFSNKISRNSKFVTVIK